MAKEKKSILKKGQASFQLIGEAKVNDYTFKINEEADSGWIYNVLNIGIDCGNGNVVYADMMGGYSSVNDTEIYAHGKKKNDNDKEIDDYQNKINVDWEDRFDLKILEDIGDKCFITVGLEKDEKGKTFSKRFLSEYDAIEYIKEHLVEGTVVNVKGDLKYSEYQGDAQLKKEIRSIFLSRADDPSKYSATFQQAILVDKDSIEKYDKELGAFPISAYVVDYVGKYGKKKIQIKQNVAFPRTFLFEVAEEELEKGTKLINRLFKAKKDNVNEVTVEGNIIEGQAKVNITIDDVPDDIKELIDLGAYTEEEALAKCAVGNNTREKKMVIKKPLIRLTGDGDDKKPVIVRTDEKYKFDELVFLSQLLPEEDENEDKTEEKTTSNNNSSDSNDTSSGDYSMDDLDELLNQEDDE